MILFLVGVIVGVLFPIMFPSKFNLVKKKVARTIIDIAEKGE